MVLEFEGKAHFLSSLMQELIYPRCLEDTQSKQLNSFWKAVLVVSPGRTKPQSSQSILVWTPYSALRVSLWSNFISYISSYYTLLALQGPWIFCLSSISLQGWHPFTIKISAQIKPPKRLFINLFEIVLPILFQKCSVIFPFFGFIKFIILWLFNLLVLKFVSQTSRITWESVRYPGIYLTKMFNTFAEKKCNELFEGIKTFKNTMFLGKKTHFHILLFVKFNVI